MQNVCAALPYLLIDKFGEGQLVMTEKFHRMRY